MNLVWFNLFFPKGTFSTTSWNCSKLSIAVLVALTRKRSTWITASLWCILDTRSDESSCHEQDKDDKLHRNLHESLDPDVGAEDVEHATACSREIGGRERDGDEIDESDKEERLSEESEVDEWSIASPDVPNAAHEEHVHKRRDEPAD